MLRHRLTIPLLIIIIVELIAIFLVYSYKQRKIATVQPSVSEKSSQAAQQAPQTQPVATETTPQAKDSEGVGDTKQSAILATLFAKKKTFTLEGVTFSYPAILTLSKDLKGGILLHHRVSYSHIDTCNANGQAQQVPDIIDVNFSFAVVPVEIGTAMSGVRASGLDPFSVGSLDGYRVFSGSAGCSSYTYYFPLSKKKTLVVNRILPSELTQYNPNYTTVSRLEGIISADTEDAIFTAILLSKK